MEMNLTGFLWSCLLLSFFLAFSPTESANEGTKRCTVNRYGELTSFSGETVQLTLPCKYALADFTCGNYRVKVTPGNGPISEDFQFSPVTMWAKIVNTETGEYIKLRTSLKRLKKYQQGKKETAFVEKEGSLDDLDVMGYDDTLTALLLKKNDVFDVTFSVVGDVAVRCHLEDFTSDPVPDTWCGDAENSVAMQNGFSELFGDISSATLETYVNFFILSDTTVTQSKTCKTLSAKFQSCAAKTEAVTQCDVITNDLSTAQCLVQSDTPLVTYYSDCVNSVCDGDDASAMDATNSYIRDHCSDGTGTQDTTPAGTTPVPTPDYTTTMSSETSPAATTQDPACQEYQVLDDMFRDVNGGYSGKCDNTLTPGWYRFVLNGINAVMPTYCVPILRCGGAHVFWLDLQDKQLPAVGQETAARACCHSLQECCLFALPVTVRNCGSFYVYKLVPARYCSQTYCAKRV